MNTKSSCFCFSLLILLWACGPAPSVTQDQVAEESVQEQGSDGGDNNSGNNSPNNSTASNGSGDAGIAGPEPVMDAGTTGEEPQEDPIEEPSSGACDNEADEAELDALEDTLDDVVGDCAINCVNNADVATCGRSCVSENSNLSEGCSGCFGDIIACTLDNCAVQCILPDSDWCASCREDNCNDDFEACAGISAQ